MEYYVSGADCGRGCDHTPVVAQMRVRVKKIKKSRRIRKDWNILGRNHLINGSYEVEVGNRYERLRDEVEGDRVQRDWKVIQDALVGAAIDNIRG